MQCVAGEKHVCNTLQHTATHTSDIHTRVEPGIARHGQCASRLQHTASHQTILHYTAPLCKKKSVYILNLSLELLITGNALLTCNTLQHTTPYCTTHI